MIVAAVLAGAYLVGTFPTGVLLARAKGVDLRSVGSGNVGATNVGRALGRGYAALTFLGDFGKGFAAVLAARALLEDAPFIALAGLAAVLGHVFPIWLRMRGGKGVATGLGVVFGLVPLVALAGAIVWTLVYAKTRISSVGSIAAAVVVAVATPFFTPVLAYRALAAALLLIVLATHRQNIARLRRGEELRG